MTILVIVLLGENIGLNRLIFSETDFVADTGS